MTNTDLQVTMIAFSEEAMTPLSPPTPPMKNDDFLFIFAVPSVFLFILLEALHFHFFMSKQYKCSEAIPCQRSSLTVSL